MTRNSRPGSRGPSFLSLGLFLCGALLAACGGEGGVAPVGSDVGPTDQTTISQSRATPSSPSRPGKPSKPATPTPAPTEPETPTKPSTPASPDAPGTPSSPSATGPAVAVAWTNALPAGRFTPVVGADIASTPALYAVADWTGVSAGQVERLELVSPDGSLYYALDIPLSDTSTSLVHVSTLPDTTVRAVYELVVWGTPIDLYNQVGTWTATAKLEGGDTVASATVVLR